MTKLTKEFMQDIISGNGFGVAPSAVAEMARQWLASMEQEPVAYMHYSGQVVTREECCDDKTFAICCKVETPLYAAPQLPQPAVGPQPVSAVKGELAFIDHLERIIGERDKDIDIGQLGRGNYDALMLAALDAFRAAMLQGAESASQSDEFPIDYLEGHKDGLEWAAQMAEANHPQTGDWLYDDPLELAKAIRKGPDMPTASAQWWIPCSERMPKVGEYVLCLDGLDKYGHFSHDDVYTAAYCDRLEAFTTEYYGDHDWMSKSNPNYWAPIPKMPAAPQQEVK